MTGFMPRWSLAMLVIASCAWGQGESESVEKERSWDAYEIIIQRNIFSRDRGQPVARGRPSGGYEETTPRIERHLMLIGIAREEDRYLAFIEDIWSGETTKVRIGDNLSWGWVTSITLDSIEYNSDGEEVSVAIGEYVDNRSPSVSASRESPERAGETEVPAGEVVEERPAATSGEESILERLKRKREKELGQ